MSLPFQPLHTGNIADDDAQVIDDLVQPQANPPAPVPDEMTIEVVKRPTPVTRLQTGRQLLLTGWEATQILPSDEFRQQLVLSLNSSDVTDSVSVGSHAQSARNGGVVFQANPLYLRDYTGPVWVYNGTAHDVTVSWWAVTK